ncbi:hypothetical protein VUR80DRAFT_42 [Thermomyces stellatus]
MDKSLRPRCWPTFMEKRVPKELTYKSEKAVGIIYEKVHNVAFHPTYSNPFDKRILDKCVKGNELCKRARQIKTQYDTALRRIMGQREITTEFEIWSGFVLSRPRVGSGYKLQEDIGREYGSIKMTFREICQKAAGGSSAPRIDAFVAAMYKVTQEEVNITLHERRGAINLAGKVIEPKTLDARSMPLISFPWIFYEVLCRLATGTKSLEMPQEMKSKESIDTQKVISTEVADGNHATHLTDGRIMHRGEALNLFEPTEDEEAPGTLAQSEATTQAGSDARAGDSTRVAQDEAGSDLPKRVAPWLETSMRKRGPGKPDARTLMMSQIEKALADMRTGKQVKAASRKASVVSAPEVPQGKGVTGSKALPGFSDTTNNEKTLDSKFGAIEPEDLVDLSVRSEEVESKEVPENKPTSQDWETGEEPIEKHLDLLTRGHVQSGTLTDCGVEVRTGRHDARLVGRPATVQADLRADDEPEVYAAGTDGDKQRVRGPLNAIPEENGTSMKHRKQGNEPGKENRPNATTSNDTKKTAAHVRTKIPGAGEREGPKEAVRQCHSPNGTAAETKARKALAAAYLPSGRGIPAEAGTRAKAGAGKSHRAKRKKQRSEMVEVIEVMEPSAIDLLLDL